MQGEQFSHEKLASNLFTILDLNYKTPEKAIPQLKIIDTFKDNAEDAKREIFKKLFDCRKRRRNMHQVNSLLPIFINDPEPLVGREIHHKCFENGEVEWFRATVKSVHKLNKDHPAKTYYNVIYDESVEDTWRFPLLVDLKKGDLVVK